MPMHRPFTFIDLFAGLGGFHLALKNLGGNCVFASEIDETLRRLYKTNFNIEPDGDVRAIAPKKVPKHDVLCAGFPCQPFSKAGEQLGTRCPKWGDLFTYVLRILEAKRPKFFILENVPNLIKHDGGKTWLLMKQALEQAGYSVSCSLLSPHWFGIPQIRERAYIVGARCTLNHFNWPAGDKTQEPSLINFLENSPAEAKSISNEKLRILGIWQEFLNEFPSEMELPSFPIWAMEFGADYPYEDLTPHQLTDRQLCKYHGAFGFPLHLARPELRRSFLPSYARTHDQIFPNWKIDFIRKNRTFFNQHKRWLSRWSVKIKDLEPSYQKFEWNCKGSPRDLWKLIIQFRASGIRVKRPTSSPSLIAMTTTQVPIVGWEKRYMTPRECARIQSLGELKSLPSIAGRAYKALGNAVNSDVVFGIALSLLSPINNEVAVDHKRKVIPQLANHDRIPI